LFIFISIYLLYKGVSLWYFHTMYSDHIHLVYFSPLPPCSSEDN
jgi:hypothetical protein